MGIHCKWDTISRYRQCKHKIINNRADKNTVELLKVYESRLKNRIQLTSASVIQICCIYRRFTQNLHKLTTLKDLHYKTENELGWNFCLSKFHLRKCIVGSLIYYFKF